MSVSSIVGTVVAAGVVHPRWMFVVKVEGDAVRGRMWSPRLQRWTKSLDCYAMRSIGQETPRGAKPVPPFEFVAVGPDRYKWCEYMIVNESRRSWRVWRDKTPLECYRTKTAAEEAVRAENW